MDEDIRQLRSRRWHQGENPDPEPTAYLDDLAARVSGAPDYRTSDNVSINASQTLASPEKEDDEDDASMLRQLDRTSVPYSFLRPSSRTMKSEEAVPGAAAAFFEPPGSYPSEPMETQHTDEPVFEKQERREATPVDEPQRTCRICFSAEAPDDKLISPCKCRGTSKWIHINCLNQWRMHSQNSKSFYRCDQCHYSYSFRRTDFANFLLSRYTLLALTFIAFMAAAFLGGFVIKFGLFLLPPEYLGSTSSWSSSLSFFYTPLDAGTDMLSATSALIPSRPRTWQDIFVIDVWHFAQGIISLGFIGIVGFMGTGGLFSLRTIQPRGARRRNEGLGFAELAFILVILLGCGRFFYTMWRRVQAIVKRKLADLGERILEVDPDRP